MQLSELLEYFGDETSVGPVIQMAQRFSSKSLVVQSALLTLGSLPQTPASYTYVVSLLNNANTDPYVVQSALAYFAKQNDNRGLAFARRYLRTTTNDEVRLAALYVLSNLNEASVKDEIIRELGRSRTDHRKHLLLQGLSNITTVSEFRASTRNINHHRRYYKSALRKNHYNNSAGAERLTIARQMFEEPYMHGDRQKAIKYLLNERSVETIENYLNEEKDARSRILIKNEIRKRNYDLRKLGDRVIIEPLD
jgi:hypothetical protein